MSGRYANPTRRSWPVLLGFAVVACGDNSAGPVPVASIRLDREALELEYGDSTQLTVTALDAAGTSLGNRPVTWTSSDAAMARVNADGTVIGLAAGSATITARVEGASASATVTVHPWNIADAVVVIDSTRLRLVSDSAERAAGRLRFQVLQGAAPAAAAGAIVVGAEAGGFLRRVTTSSQAGGVLTLETSPASLADAVEEGGFSTTIDLLFAPATGSGGLARPRSGEVIWGEGRFKQWAPGMALRAGGFDLSGLDICEVLAVGASLGGGTCPQGIDKLVIARGRLEFEPDYELTASFSGFALERFRGVLKGSVELDAALRLEAKVDLGSFKPDVTLFTFTRPFYAQIGPVPVVGYVELVVKATLELKATAKGTLEGGIEARASVELGAEWEDQWSLVSNSQGSFTPQIPSIAAGTLAGNIEMEASLGLKPRAQIIFYGLIGPFAEVEPYGKATLTFGTSGCSFGAELGYNGAIGFTIPFLDKNVSDFGQTWKPLVSGPSATWECPLGALDVHTTTNGQNPDENGYTVLVDGKDRGRIDATGQHVVPYVEVGSRTVSLEDVAPNCTVQGGATRTVSVALAGVHPVSFVIDCTALTGTIEVTTQTSGPAPTGGYSVGVAGSSRAIGQNETVVFESVALGSHTVSLTGVPSNCAVSGGSSVVVEVVSGGTARVTFDIGCTASELVVRTATSGPPASVSGWTVLLDGVHLRTITPNGQATFSTTPGSHTVLLDGLPPNCDVAGANPRTVDVSASGATDVQFNVHCQGAGLSVTVSTQGDPAPATSYTVSAGGQTQTVGVNGSVSFADLAEGSISVGLQGVPAHCTVQGLNPRTVVVPGTVEFEVVCEQPAQCTQAPAWMQTEMFNRSYINEGQEYQGSSGSSSVVRNVFGDVEVSANATDATTWGSSNIYIAEAGWIDYVSFVPVDAARVGEGVELRFRRTGFVDVVNAVASYADIGDFGRYPDVPTGGANFSTTFDVVETWPYFVLGEWRQIADWIGVYAQAKSATTSTIRARTSIALVEVIDSNGAVVPISTVCTVSGAQY